MEREPEHILQAQGRPVRDPDFNVERTPPQNIELEMCVLGGIMLEPQNSYPVAASILSRESFYLDGHGIIFELMGELHARGIPPDSDMVLDELRARSMLDQVGGAAVILSMLNSVAGAAGVEYHSRKLEDKALLRAGVRAATQIIEECYRQELLPADIGQQMYQASIMMSGGGGDAAISLHDGLVAYWDAFEQRAAAVAEIVAQRGGRPRLKVGLDTGIYELDKLIRGLRPGQLVFISGDTSMGKTAFGLQLALHITTVRNLPMSFFSLEMDEADLVERLLCMATYTTDIISGRIRGVPTNLLDSPNLDEDQMHMLENAKAIIQDAPMRIHAPGKLTIADLRTALRRDIREHGIVAAVVDYLGCIRADNPDAPPYQQLCQITGDLKSVAREFKIPLIVPNQLSRADTGRVGIKRPTLHAMRDSGSIEQDADIVLALYRESYHTGENKINEAGAPQLPEAEILVLKNRNGPTTGPFNGVKTYWFGPITRFLPASKGSL